MGRAFANGPGNLGSIPGHVIPKTQKWYLIPPCLTLSNIKYISRVKWSNPGKGVALSTTPRCSSYWKRSLLVTLDYGCQLYYYMYVIYVLKRKLEKEIGNRSVCWFLFYFGGTLSIMFIIVGNEIWDLCSNPRWGCLCFFLHWYPWEKYESICSPQSCR